MNLYQKIVGFFFPPKCVGCGKSGFHICPDCTRELSGKKSGSFFELEYFEKIYVFAEWDNPLVKEAIHKLKFRYSKGMLDDIKNFFRENYPDDKIPKDSNFVPVPLHTMRHNERGFNQSELIAEIFSYISCDENRVFNILKRVKKTDQQALLDKEEREENVENAFIVSNASAKDLNKKKPVILVDDVSTTGNTLVACAKALKEYGFERIFGIVVA